jgi:lipopolysaccharide transport system permease protein
MASNIEFEIAPPKGWLSINWKELWRFKDLFITLAWRDIAVRYKQTGLGVLWAVFQPFICMLVFTFIFNRMAKIESGDGTPYPLFVYVGLILWQYFANTLTEASNSLVRNPELIQKVYFPRLIIPASVAITGLVDLAISSIILVGMMIYYGFLPHLAGILVLPMLIVCIILSAMGVGMFLAAINVKYRDVRYALPFLIQFMLYITPVIYPTRMLNKYVVIKTLMLWLNPIAGVITNARVGILSHGPIHIESLCISLLISIVFFIFGLCYFRNSERHFADLV